MEAYRVKKAVWNEHANRIRKLRETVFVIEQGVSSRIEWDGRDHLCEHAIALTNSDVIIGTGRMLPSGHIGRIAVLSSYRGQGIGKILIDQLITMAKEAGLGVIYLNSQMNAKSFYQRFGFVAKGPVYMDVGIPHQRMELILEDKFEK